MKHFWEIAAAAALATSMATTAGAASLAGETVGIDFIYGADENSVLADPGNGDFVVGMGPETSYFSQFTVDVSANQVVLEFGVNSFWQSGNPFNGLRISDAFGAFGAFLSLTTVLSEFEGAPVVSFDDDNLFLNFAGSGGVDAGDRAVFSFTVADTAAIPLPAALPLLLAGIGGLAAMRRRSRHEI